MPSPDYSRLPPTVPLPCVFAGRGELLDSHLPDAVTVGTAVRHGLTPRRWAGPLNEFHRRHLNPYVNYHRPCLFPETVTDKNGKQRKRYPYESLMTPYEKLKSLDDAQTYLKPGLSFDILDKVAYRISDNAAADALQQARRELFTTIHEQEYKRA